MIHTFIGNFGHLMVIVSFVTSLLAAYAYFKVANEQQLDQKESWRKFARASFYAHALSVVAVVYALFHIILNQYYEYHYAWAHSSKVLPLEYIIACFWEGQEGSFLIWILWHALLGIVIINTNKFWEGPVMTVFALVQAFLASMILGVVIGDFKIGSSPFMLTREVISAPIFQIDPNFVPEDGTGLNPLLQNYWMVIHPPTLFLGFAATLVPFAYLIAGLWLKKYTEWIRPALPWSHFAALVLGAGIIMGAYWAYETLNFGGYWNWDPVENAVYVPWLILVAGIHTMITFKKSNTALKSSFVLIIAAYVLILYSTFLTRSGILGNASVHSFTDLGLSGQLLVYLLFFTLGAIILAARAWKDIPSSEREVSMYSREFWIFLGATVLTLMAFQVIIPTSIPVYSAIIEAFGGISNIAPPADQVAFYSKFQLWFAVAVAILSGVGQFFFWQKMDETKLKSELLTPYIVSLVLTALVVTFAQVFDIKYIIALAAGLFTITANVKILIGLLKKSSFKLAAGSFTHIGVGLMLIGTMFSSGYSETISINRSGFIFNREFPDEVNVEHVLLFYDDPIKMDDYEVVYKGRLKEVKGIPGYVPYQQMIFTDDPYVAIAETDITVDGKVYAAKGARLDIYQPENTFYEVTYKKGGKDAFTLYPRGQINEQMGDGILASPDIEKYWDHDLYTYVFSIVDDTQRKWSDVEKQTVKIGEQFILNDYVATFEKVETMDTLEGEALADGEVALMAYVKIEGKESTQYLKPIYAIKNGMVGRVTDTDNELGLKITLAGINPESDSFEFNTQSTQKDYVIMKAIVKPHINILWIGTLVLMFGFGLAIYRRYTEFIKMRDKGVE
ncbi:cytochrome c biogenesis protein CcsA [Penaeicola halotolerans]|uniref:cytochrome c biogenesis protein CcsA n=1 Tax=Penaeicola halotolerans TaxID=2793196 RepID=UPI001CF826B6|nr:cytochrome c biogenesis protein CcsA [Penaeicola halotolerans]